jgi:murein DD-endopeptidase MepM/ murein hydrolase activator NlpD
MEFLYFPVKNPINQSNLFGANPQIYKPLGQDGHPGNDFEAPSGTPVYAPCDGGAFYTYDSLGGDGLWIRYPNNSNPQFNIILWHMYPKGTKVTLSDGTTDDAFKIPTNGSVTQVKAGQLLGYSDNSGYPKESTGPHLHLGVMPCNSDGSALNPNNGFLGCVDPTPYYIGQYAEDIPLIQQVVQKSSQVVQLVASATDAQVSHQDKLTILQQIEAFIQSLL